MRNVSPIFVLILTVCGISQPVVRAETITFDAARDWSDVSNPNGAWTYHGNNGSVLSTNQADWDPNAHLLLRQRVWADDVMPRPGHVPAWFRVSEPSALDVVDVGMHGAESAVQAWIGISWRSPSDGKIRIAGGVWQALKTSNDGLQGNHRERSSDWRLRLNDTILASGTVSGKDDFTSASPYTFVSGAGGNALTDIVVDRGDNVVLEFISPNSYSTFNGVDIRIHLDATATADRP